MPTDDDWDDFRLFQALAEHGTARRAAASLGVSHSKLSRRIERLEEKLSVLLFDRSQRGFNLTEAGTLLLESTRSAESRLNDGRRKVTGLDQKLSGPIRVTMPDILAFGILMPAIGKFHDNYPAIELDIDISYAAADLEQRDADVAVRMLPIDESPPDQLIGRKIAQSYASAYATPAYLDQHDIHARESTARWLGWNTLTDREWIDDTPYANLTTRGIFNHAELQNRAARCGLGIAYMPCALAGCDDVLVQLPGMKPRPARDIWLLTHRDLRDATRMKLFRAEMAEAIISAKSLLHGKARGG